MPITSTCCSSILALHIRPLAHVFADILNEVALPLPRSLLPRVLISPSLKFPELKVKIPALAKNRETRTGKPAKLSPRPRLRHRTIHRTKLRTIDGCRRKPNLVTASQGRPSAGKRSKRLGVPKRGTNCHAVRVPSLTGLGLALPSTRHCRAGLSMYRSSGARVRRFMRHRSRRDIPILSAFPTHIVTSMKTGRTNQQIREDGQTSHREEADRLRKIRSANPHPEPADKNNRKQSRLQGKRRAS